MTACKYNLIFTKSSSHEKKAREIKPGAALVGRNTDQDYLVGRYNWIIDWSQSHLTNRRIIDI